MNLLIKCAVLLVLAVGLQAQDGLDDWPGDYDYADVSKQNSQEDTNELAVPDAEPNVEQKHSNELLFIEDYQFEDNRSGDKENKEEPMPDDGDFNLDDYKVLPLEVEEKKVDEPQESLASTVKEDEVTKVDDAFDVFDEPVKTTEIEAAPAQSNETPESTPPANVVADMEKIIEETNKILEENDGDNFEADDDYPMSDELDDEEEVSFEDLFGFNDDDTPGKVIDDLTADLDKLSEIIDKLSADEPTEGNVETTIGNEKNEVEDYEDKYGIPFKEGNIMSIREDYENFDDDNKNEETENVVENNEKSQEGPTTLVSDDTADDDFEKFMQSLNFEESQEVDEKLDQLIDDLIKNSYGEDGLVDDQQPKNDDAELLPTTAKAEVVLPAASTAVTQTDDVTTDSESVLSTIDETLVPRDSESSTPNDVSPTTESETETRPTIMVKDLNSAEYDVLMQQFAFAHSEDLDMKSEDFAKNVAPIHITINSEEPTVITSPNFPFNYPTNNIVDWIIEGPGSGIEMNVTQFAVNGAVGDYLLVKPGGNDASGTDGLIFSFQLQKERRYRFANVNRMFVRFESKPGMSFFQGFSFSVRMIFPPRSLADDEEPVTEAIISKPVETMELALAGLTLPQFLEIRPAFKQLVADMAEAYILENEIERGLNTTLEVTQIVRTAICNIRWPEYETCVSVQFGVPLQFEDDTNGRLDADDLDAMWRTYIVQEPFVTRLGEMGITEYAIPNDRSILTVWVVIAAGVVISMAMLAFALWRFSCFEDYTRMRAYSDNDSVHNEKKTLDLYPTPHQTLPPLYSDVDYKWADDNDTRVDVGGFANKSYVRDNLFDFDSDEDIIAPRDRYTTNV